MDLFVTDIGAHTIFRGTAILFALYIIYAAIIYQDIVLFMIGLLTILVDTYTFCLSLKAL